MSEEKPEETGRDINKPFKMPKLAPLNVLPIIKPNNMKIIVNVIL